MKQKPIELYDMGRCTHKAVPGMYQFIMEHADAFVADLARAAELKASAANRELPGYSISQDQFTEMCGIWVAAYRSGAFPIDIQAITFPDTPTRFRAVRDAGRNVGILTSGSRDFTEILYSLPLEEGGRLSHFVDEYLLGEEIGDKDHAETFGRLWEAKQGQIAAVFDDKVSVCEAAVSGFRQAGGSSRIYLVDRKGSYENIQGELADRVRVLEGQGVQRIKSFDQVLD